MTHIETKINTILTGKVKILQPAYGYRAGTDAVLLAASISAKPKEHVLDVGCGVGTSLMALHNRCPEIFITGLEIQTTLCEIAKKNISLNNIASNKIDIINDDLLNVKSNLSSNSYDWIMSNPPYFVLGKGRLSPHSNKAISHCADANMLKEWVNFCVRMLKPRGYVTFIFTSTRINDLLPIMCNKLGGIIIYPLWPKQNVKSKLVIVQGRKGVKTPTTLSYGMIMQDNLGKPTHELEKILQYGKQLAIK